MTPERMPLAERLVRSSDAGLYALVRGERAGIAACAHSLGFSLLVVDLAGCVDKAEFLDRMAAALHFPDWFGRNWDALADCLADMSWQPADGYVIILEHTEDLHRHAPAAFDTALQILTDAAHQHAAHDIPMWILIASQTAGVTGLRSL